MNLIIHGFFVVFIHFSKGEDIMELIKLNCRCCGELYEVFIVNSNQMENGFCSFECEEEFLCLI